MTTTPSKTPANVKIDYFFVKTDNLDSNHIPAIHMPTPNNANSVGV